MIVLVGGLGPPPATHHETQIRRCTRGSSPVALANVWLRRNCPKRGNKISRREMLSQEGSKMKLEKTTEDSS